MQTIKVSISVKHPCMLCLQKGGKTGKHQHQVFLRERPLKPPEHKDETSKPRTSVEALFEDGFEFQKNILVTFEAQKRAES